MKKVIAGILLLAFLFAIGATFYPSDTVHCEWKLLRAEANENSTTIDLTSEGDYANKPSTAVRLRTASDQTQSGANFIEVIFCGGSADGKTFTYTLYAWRRDNGMARLICTGTGTLGSQAVVKYPHTGSAATSKFWADTLSCTSRWPKEASSSNAVGNNEVACIIFDMIGYEYLYCEITSADGTTGDEAGNVSAYYAYW